MENYPKPKQFLEGQQFSQSVTNPNLVPNSEKLNDPPIYILIQGQCDLKNGITQNVFQVLISNSPYFQVGSRLSHYSLQELLDKVVQENTFKTSHQTPPSLTINDLIQKAASIGFELEDIKEGAKLYYQTELDDLTPDQLKQLDERIEHITKRLAQIEINRTRFKTFR
ncbi:MAG TPA: hypothetical protein PKY82_29145 [Pyrinomonadaceae bacterium]|nr:hypothetical protein [Pyrinomonadaceae bacterium]